MGWRHHRYLDFYSFSGSYAQLPCVCLMLCFSLFATDLLQIQVTSYQEVSENTVFEHKTGRQLSDLKDRKNMRISKDINPRFPSSKFLKASTRKFIEAYRFLAEVLGNI